MSADEMSPQELIDGVIGWLGRLNDFDCRSMMAQHGILQSQSLLERASAQLPPEIASQAKSLADRCAVAIQRAGWPHDGGLLEGVRELRARL